MASEQAMKAAKSICLVFIGNPPSKQWEETTARMADIIDRETGLQHLLGFAMAMAAFPVSSEIGYAARKALADAGINV